MKKELSLKVYYVVFGIEDKDGYSENVEKFSILAKTVYEAIEEAKKRLSMQEIKEGYVVEGIELVCVVN